MCPIYKITCNLCNELYICESSRSLHDRLGEHLRFATNPSNPSYKNEAFAEHYGQHHPGQTPDLTFKLIKTERNTILRKVYEAMLIYEYKPIRLGNHNILQCAVLFAIQFFLEPLPTVKPFMGKIEFT